MPRGDGRGPTGQGPMTGRGMGYCAGYPVPGFANPGNDRGMGRGMARGMGMGRQMAAPMTYYQPAAPADEKKALAEEAKMLEEELKLVKDRISEIGK